MPQTIAVFPFSGKFAFVCHAPGLPNLSGRANGVVVGASFRWTYVFTRSGRSTLYRYRDDLALPDRSGPT